LTTVDSELGRRSGKKTARLGPAARDGFLAQGRYDERRAQTRRKEGGREELHWRQIIQVDGNVPVAEATAQARGRRGVGCDQVRKGCVRGSSSAHMEHRREGKRRPGQRGYQWPWRSAGGLKLRRSFDWRGNGIESGGRSDSGATLRIKEGH
jgi:hypothetical protein